MFIQTEQTPNPDTLKFLPGRVVLEKGSADFTDTEAARVSPLATVLFNAGAVAGVFLGSDFISVTKSSDADWTTLKPLVLGAIMDHFVAGHPVMSEPVRTASDEDGDDDEIVVQIKELLETRVRPVVAQDGGDITFQGFEDGVLYLTMRGACAGCPSSTMTLKNGIENMMRHFIPEVKRVEAAL